MAIWDEAGRALLRGVVRQAGRLPPTRRALHALSLASRGAGIAVLRCRRLVPDTAEGRAHPDRVAQAALTPAQLAAELQAAARVFRFVHVREALEHLTEGRRLTEPLAVLTFDESFAATAELALPVCKTLGVPFTMFVTTAHLHGPHEHWGHALWDVEVRAAVEQLAPRPLSVPWIDRVLATTTAKKRAGATKRLLLSLASLDDDRLKRRLGQLWERTGAVRVGALDRMLSADELVRLAAEPLVSIGAHGFSHVAMAGLEAPALVRELEGPRAALASLTGAAFANILSYPFGHPPYVDAAAIEAARAAGYAAAFWAVPGVARPGNHLFQLPRLPLGTGSGALATAQLQGSIEALDELLLIATRSRARWSDSLYG